VFYYIAGAVLVAGMLYGLAMMNKVKTAKAGNRLSAVCVAVAIILVLFEHKAFSNYMILACIAVGFLLGSVGAAVVRMTQMPQAVALLNGFGGLASALVALVVILEPGGSADFKMYTAGVSLAVGLVTFTGSLVAAGKLAGIMPRQPVIWKGHFSISTITLALVILSIIFINSGSWTVWLAVAASAFFGVVFTIRIGGADMPIAISLLNSFSGVAGGIAGMAVFNPVLISVGGIVGASGLVLTQIMCRAMNRSLLTVLFGKTTETSGVREHGTLGNGANQQANTERQHTKGQHIGGQNVEGQHVERQHAEGQHVDGEYETISPEDIISKAQKVIIIPGYGMALAQAQQQVKKLYDKLEEKGAEVKFAMHPVAGRMPGHMNVLLCEVDIPYDKLYEMDDINPEFAECDLAIVVGANDVINPAANTAEGTPIYGMPVLDAEKAKHIIICNFDTKPGYSGVPNPLYSSEKAILMLGDAKETVERLADIAGKTA
jgi:NAD(P) transhydrogenase subunit beta